MHAVGRKFIVFQGRTLSLVLYWYVVGMLVCVLPYLQIDSMYNSAIIRENYMTSFTYAVGYFDS